MQQADLKHSTMEQNRRLLEERNAQIQDVSDQNESMKAQIEKLQSKIEQLSAQNQGKVVEIEKRKLQMD